MKSIDTQRFKRNYLSGMTAQEWCEWGLALNDVDEMGLMDYKVPSTAPGGLPTPHPNSSSNSKSKLHQKSQ